ncbi:class I SAM-dependent methyltransferase [Pseudomonas aeruginosa]|uniref:class I SAM-dependent methyltransferase n=1 Tax=Pseudomonas aeruginosa TaxID=287 RepID=UPI0003B98B26|nr:class I SAM-dependent methyltransferase [Pseudomonas aeruginosa]EIU3183669.1 class I SAM-dependent methyltransferase [Pseudomonas aeruginosa]EIU3227791.1 class I SAM-dependent methyltransferase [Pseudomonas aeruginosa]EIU3241123.1 class I SAM-dependent methyltransferase [Pseudomonas aeruginosa]EKQ6359694.1 class I SAM-dependent methyltransferase [Pseudomonas aeruginosa]EKU7531085.1 class I SAM-dependent methyltransferase [Pseudomonas aeruginosa]
MERSRRLERSWRGNAEAWARAVREGRLESRRLATDDAILQALRQRAPRRLLDIGCGEGWLCRALAGEVGECVGIDASPELIELARAAGGGRFRRLAYRELDAASGLGRFDALVCNFSLLDEDLAGCLAAWPALLESGGELLIQTLHPWAAGDEDYCDGWREERFDGFGEGFRDSMPWYFRTLESWLALLDGSGWRLRGLSETVHPRLGRPLSLLLRAGLAE